MRLPPRVHHQLTHLAAHLTSALRLRSAVAPADPEAALDLRGHVLDASGPARERDAWVGLAEAVRRMERARGPLRRADPEEALQLWQGLVDGSWSLLDQRERDGKRFLLARRNSPGARDPAALTPGERAVLAAATSGHANKYIAYLLGISASQVTAHLAAARRKLRAGSRAELIQRFGPWLRRLRFSAPAGGATGVACCARPSRT